MSTAVTTTNGHALAVSQPTALAIPSANEWSMIVSMAKTLHASGLLPKHIGRPEAAAAIILKGRELGIGAMQALTSINMIDGRLTASANLIAALIYQRCGDNALIPLEQTAARCTIQYQRPGWTEPRRLTWTIEMAQQAGLTGKDNWRKYPGAMLFSRCVSAIGATAFQDVVMGLYTPEEMESNDSTAPVDEANGVTVDTMTGEVIDIQPLSAEQGGEIEQSAAPRAVAPPRQQRSAPAHPSLVSTVRAALEAGWEQEVIVERMRERYGVIRSSDLTAAQSVEFAAWLATQLHATPAAETVEPAASAELREN